jgi:endonuclease YncB( thermonuclease family)
MSPQPPDVEMVSTGDDVFVVFNGVRIAKRGHPKTPKLALGCRSNPAGECSAAALRTTL